VLTAEGQPIVDADVMLITPMPKEIQYRTYEFHIPARACCRSDGARPSRGRMPMAASALSRG